MRGITIEPNFGGRVDVPRHQALGAGSKRLLTNGVGVEIGPNPDHSGTLSVTWASASSVSS